MTLGGVNTRGLGRLVVLRAPLFQTFASLAYVNQRLMLMLMLAQRCVCGRSRRKANPHSVHLGRRFGGRAELRSRHLTLR